MGHHDPDASDLTLDDEREAGALLIYLFLRDVHMIRSSLISRPKGYPPDVDP